MQVKHEKNLWGKTLCDRTDSEQLMMIQPAEQSMCAMWHQWNRITDDADADDHEHVRLSQSLKHQT